jgi:hypothetical protein
MSQVLAQVLNPADRASTSRNSDGAKEETQTRNPGLAGIPDAGRRHGLAAICLTPAPGRRGAGIDVHDGRRAMACQQTGRGRRMQESAGPHTEGT